MIRAEALTKKFGDKTAVDGISFQVEGGEIYGLLGPNGAGKTTTLSMLSGLLAPDAGRITFEGVDLAADPVRCKMRLGVVPQDVALYEELSALENVRFWGSLYGLSGKALKAAAERALAQVGLSGRSRDVVRTYSGGMKRRLNLALGLVHEPRAVLLDEVTVGIDPQARASILDVVRAVADAGTAVIYTTHYLEEAERLCDRIAIVDHGRILAEGKLDALKAQLGDEETVTLWGRFEAAAARAALGRLPGARVLSAEPGRVALTAGGSGAAGLLGTIHGSGLAIERIALDELAPGEAETRAEPPGRLLVIPRGFTENVLAGRQQKLRLETASGVRGDFSLAAEAQVVRAIVRIVGRLAETGRTDERTFAALAGRMLLAGVQSVVLLAAGRWLFGVSWGSSPGGLALLLGAWLLAVAALATLLGAVLSTPEQASAVGWVGSMLLAGLGGSGGRAR